ncbi:MAG: RidA family protein [Candidatus Limnocylindrales bacterium]
MSHQRIQTSDAPAAIGPYSQAIDTGEFVFCAGQVGVDPATGELVEGLEAQTERALDNIAAVLGAAGLGLGDVVKTTCFLADLADFGAFNAHYGTRFPEPPPARSTVQAALPKGARVEIEVVAHRPRLADAIARDAG